MPSEEEEILVGSEDPKTPSETGPNPGSPGPIVPPTNPPSNGG